MTPADLAQFLTNFISAFDGLPNLLGPLLENIGQALKMHVSVFVGGPEPRLGGKINMIR